MLSQYPWKLLFLVKNTSFVLFWIEEQEISGRDRSSHGCPSTALANSHESPTARVEAVRRRLMRSTTRSIKSTNFHLYYYSFHLCCIVQLIERRNI